MTDLPQPDYDEAIDVVVENLAVHYPTIDQAEIRGLVAEAVARIASDTKAPSFVAVLAEKETRDILDARTATPEI